MALELQRPWEAVGALEEGSRSPLPTERQVSETPAQGQAGALGAGVQPG